MKKKVVKIDTSEKDIVIKEYENFFYNVEDEVEKDNKTIITFSRDIDKHKNKNEILQLEDEYNSLKIPPFTPLVVLASLSFILLTALLICIFVFKDASDKNVYIISLGIPSALCVVLLSGYYYFRMSRTNRNVLLGLKTKEKIFKRLEEIRNENE